MSRLLERIDRAFQVAGLGLTANQEMLLAPLVSLQFGRAASHIDGAASILLGIAANQSIATGQLVEIDDLLKLEAKGLARST